MNKIKETFKTLGRSLTDHPVLFFSTFSIFFGLLFVFLTPPFQNPDEFIHFARSYEVSELKTSQLHYNGKVYIKGSEMPKSILQTNITTRLYKLARYPDVPPAHKYSWHQTIKALKTPLAKSQVQFLDTADRPQYLQLLYIPQALVIKVLSLFNTPVIAMLYATRIACLLVWVGMGSLAISILRLNQFKLGLAAVLLIPMFITTAAIPGIDAILTGLTVLYLVLIANAVVEKEKLNNKNLAVLALILSAMTLAKPVYVVFGLLVYALKVKASGVKGFLYRSTLLVVPALIYLVWVSITKDTRGPIFVDSISIAHADPSTQAAYLIPNILNFVQPFVNTLLLGWGDNIFVSTIGEFGKLDTPLPLLFVGLGYLLVFLAVFVGKDNKKTQKITSGTKLPIKLLIGGALLSYIVGVYLSMYIFSTPPHEKIITGIQGRYLLPLFPLLVLFVNKDLVTMRAKIYENLMIFLPLILLVASVVVVFLRYYVYYPQ
jgi:uncharacterized membrane protein